MVNKRLKDENDNIINPITHESAVLDDNGVNIGEKLNNMEEALETINDELDNKANKEHIHEQYLTEHQDISNLATKEEVNQGKTDMEAMVAEVEGELEVVEVDLEQRGLNVKNYGAKGDGKTDDTLAIQTAINDAREINGIVLFPPGEYVISETLLIGSKENQKPVKLIGQASKGSFFNYKPVIITRPDNTTHTLLQVLGHGVAIENICFYGKNTSGNLLHIIRGFELSIQSCRFFKSQGYGILAQALSNSIIRDTHVDVCGSENIPAFRLTGNSDFEYTSNSVFLSNVHLERNGGIDLDIGYGENVDDNAEFIFINGLHIESVIDNTTMTDFKHEPCLRIGNVRGVEITNSYIYGGSGNLIQYDKKHDSGSSLTGVSISNSYILGYIKNHLVTDSTPQTLINLINGDGFYMQGCQLDTALSEHIKISSTFGENVYIYFNTHKRREGSTNTYLIDNRTGNRKGLEFSTTELSESSWTHKNTGSSIKLDSSGNIKINTIENGSVEFNNASVILFGGQRLFYGASEPSNGSYKLGDIIRNTNPIAGGYVGWVCVEPGVPGKWKGFGLIEE